MGPRPREFGLSTHREPESKGAKYVWSDASEFCFSSTCPQEPLPPNLRSLVLVSGQPLLAQPNLLGTNQTKETQSKQGLHRNGVPSCGIISPLWSSAKAVCSTEPTSAFLQITLLMIKEGKADCIPHGPGVLSTHSLSKISSSG